MMATKKPMTLRKALKEAIKRLGKNATVSFNEKALNEDEKAVVREKLGNMPTEKAITDELRAARRKLKDAAEDEKPGLQDLVKKLESDLQNRKNLAGSIYADRCRVGIVNETIPGFPLNMIEACGDTWEEVFAKLDAKKGK